VARFIRSRAQASASCYWVETADGRRVPEYAVSADARGFFNVVCARTGDVFRVAVDDATCSRADGSACPFALYVKRPDHCPHVAAVLVHAARVLEGGK